MYIQEKNNSNEMLNTQNTKRFRLYEIMNDWSAIYCEANDLLKTTVSASKNALL